MNRFYLFAEEIKYAVLLIVLLLGAALTFALTVALIVLPALLLNPPPLAVTAPYRLLDPMQAIIFIPAETTSADDDAAVLGLVRAIHARGRDALLHICAIPLQRAAGESYRCSEFYWKRGDLPDSGMRNAEQ